MILAVDRNTSVPASEYPYLRRGAAAFVRVLDRYPTDATLTDAIDDLIDEWEKLSTVLAYCATEAEIMMTLGATDRAAKIQPAAPVERLVVWAGQHWSDFVAAYSVPRTVAELASRVFDFMQQSVQYRTPDDVADNADVLSSIADNYKVMTRDDND